MEEKEKWTVPTENVEEKPKNLEEKEEKSESLRRRFVRLTLFRTMSQCPHTE